MIPRTLTQPDRSRIGRSAFFILPAFVFMLISVHPDPQQAPQSKPAGAKSDSTLVTYNDQIFDLLDKNCLGCHGQGENNPSELFMDTYAGMMEGGKHGVAVIPGDPEKSVLYQKVLPNPPFGKQMPAKSRRMLSEEEVGLIKTWIAQGAVEKKPAPKKMK